MDLRLDGRKIVSGSWDKTVRVWDAETAKPVLRLRGHEASVNSVAIFPDNRTIVSGSGVGSDNLGADDTVRVWDAQRGEELRVLCGHEDLVSNVAISSDGRQVVSSARDGTIRLRAADRAEQMR